MNQCNQSQAEARLINRPLQVHELSGCGDFLSALELARCVDDGSALVAGLHVAYGDDMFRKVTLLAWSHVTMLPAHF